MEKKLIENIRNDYSPENNTQRILEGYASSIKTLAEDLYAKDTHFIFELIQNAEDNNYETDAPSLRFVLSKTDLQVGQKNNFALIVENNETGFEQNHVEAICNVGRSTKKKDQGYIGEKGIGFKSVFRVTSCPYIYSNRYHFSLPENDSFSGLGYIVPTWVDTLPKNLNKKITTIYLPLDKRDFPVNRVVESLQDIAPETILFLKKLKSIEVEVTTDEHYEIIIEKDDSNFPLVKLTYLKKNDKYEMLEEHLYWVQSKEFSKPDNINHEKRTNVTKREVSVAIPLDGKQEGKLFAYLPVWENTGLPFLVNADFLLVSSREGVKETEPWNIWLRKCVSEVYTEAFVSCLSSELIPFEKKIKAYASIPLTTHHSFLRPEISEIQQKVKITECLFTAPLKDLSLPLKTRIAPADFWDLIIDDDFPILFQKTTPLVCQEVEPYNNTLRVLGISSLNKEEVLECLDDSKWVSSKSDDMLLKIYRYLKNHNIEDDSLRTKNIVRVESLTNKQPLMSCNEQQPIYFECDNDAKKILNDIPAWLKNLVPITFLNSNFYKLICDQEDSYELKGWMTGNLVVHDFSVASYCVDIFNVIVDKYESLSSQQLIESAAFLAKHGSVDFNWRNVPLVLNNGEKITLSEINGKVVVVPENYNRKSGWQHIWKTEDDRKHFLVLSNLYRQFIDDNFINTFGVKLFPPPYHFKDDGYYNRNYYYKAPEWMKENQREVDSLESRALFEWAKQNTSQRYVSIRKSRPDGRYNFTTNTDIASEFTKCLQNLAWLPTTKGKLSRPPQTFLPISNIIEILGNTVPYLKGELPKQTLTLLEIKTELTVDELLETLQAYSGETKNNLEMTYRIYSELEARTRFDDSDHIIEAFKNDKLIFVPGKEESGQWLSMNEVIWEDAHQGKFMLPQHRKRNCDYRQ